MVDHLRTGDSTEDACCLLQPRVQSCACRQRTVEDLFSSMAASNTSELILRDAFAARAVARPSRQTDYERRLPGRRDKQFRSCFAGACRVL
jgi:hypothetical protein